MMPLTNLHDLDARLDSLRRPLTVAVVCPRDGASAEALAQAMRHANISLRLFGCSEDDFACAARWIAQGRASASLAPTPADAARSAVAAVRRDEAQVLMKGLVNTADLLRAVLDKEQGLLPAGRVMNHVSVIEVEGRAKPIFATDVAVIPEPTLEQMHAMVGNTAALCRRLGVERPKVALIHCNEKVSEKFPLTLAHEEIKRRAVAGAYGDVCVDGPMDVKVALDARSAAVKGIVSEVAGDADVLLFPCIEAGNTFYKTVSLFAPSVMSGLLCGTTAPVTLCSRADTPQSKYRSLALACIAAGGDEAANAHEP